MAASLDLGGLRVVVPPPVASPAAAAGFLPLAAGVWQAALALVLSGARTLVLRLAAAAWLLEWAAAA
jgi:hypothetical protein